MGQAGSLPALTADEKRILGETWAIVRDDVKKHSVALFIKFFKKYPEQQKFFKAFGDVPLDQLSTHPKFMAHAMTVVLAASALIMAVDDDDIVQAMIAKQVANHAPRKVFVENFKNLSGIIHEYLMPFLTEEQNAAWTHAVALFDAGVVEASAK